MSAHVSKIFVARLLGLDVFDPLGDRLGRLRDVVVVSRGPQRAPACVGVVVEVPGKRRVFVPMTRIQSMESTQVICSGLVNMRRFQQRGQEMLVVAEMFDRTVTFLDASGRGLIEDVGLTQTRRGDWEINEYFVQRLETTSTLLGLRTRRRNKVLVSWAEIRQGAQSEPQSADNFVATHDEMKAADFADALHEMTGKRRLEVAAHLQDDRLADVLQELPDREQVEILSALSLERAADVLEEMDPDDAADLLAEVEEETKHQLLELMNEEEAEDVRRLLAYPEGTAGSVMTPVPVILTPESTVAEALASVRFEEISPALASTVYVVRPPLETPTGRYLGQVHIQALLRAAPPEPLGDILDKELEPMSDLSSITDVVRHLATYNLTSVGVVNNEGRLVGAITVDDVLDHILPDDWRSAD
ncbi:magnesium transporter [Arthrobacter sp. MYb224]|uniref:magnesium transporter MgtE N-terminal domain-containing protein n=1 Tax=Micrococcaceae TaxID=1268 RepID=UPI000CFBAF07|nr:CBS domain-containing protein [Arthrobacter sp. MYb224]PQZ99260.1 magnesium transporter [Arthrobacter sp. MYb224]